MNDHVREVYARRSVRVAMKKQDMKDRNGFFPASRMYGGEFITQGADCSPIPMYEESIQFIHHAQVLLILSSLFFSSLGF